MGWGRQSTKIAITPIFRTYYLAAKDSEMIDCLKFFAPLRNASEIFCPLLGPKNEKCPIYPKNMKKLCSRNIEKK